MENVTNIVDGLDGCTLLQMGCFVSLAVSFIFITFDLSHHAFVEEFFRDEVFAVMVTVFVSFFNQLVFEVPFHQFTLSVTVPKCEVINGAIV